MSDAYARALEFLYGRLNYERTGMPRIPSELRLGRMRRLLSALGDPQDGLRIVHVAGTKGKGSTAALMAAALTASGRRTGLFCSPHLHRLEERFRIDGVDATSDQLIALVDAVRRAVEGFDADSTHHRHRGPTFFEITTAMGLLHFAREATDAVLLEVGLGGRLDSTNCVRPALSVITSISFDHVKQLGATLEAIATEKAGILKRGRPAVVGVLGGSAREAIRRVARQRHAPLREVGSDFDFSYQAPALPLHQPAAGSVSIRTWRANHPPIRLPLLGPHQAHNAAVAVAAIDALNDQGWGVDHRAIEAGWSRLIWPARVEVFGRSPWIVIDGAHNVALGLCTGRDAPDVLSGRFPDARLRHHARQGPRRSTRRASAPIRSDHHDPLRGESPLRPAGGDRPGGPFPRGAAAGDGRFAGIRPEDGPGADALRRPDCRDRIALPGRRVAGRPALRRDRIMSGGNWLRIGAASAAIAVALGAFGAHVLTPKTTEWEQMPSGTFIETERRLANFETAVRYHMYHALALVAIGLASTMAGGRGPRSLQVAGWAFLIGTLAFSGSLYVIGVGGPRRLGMVVTPAGGICLIVGWIALACSRLAPRHAEDSGIPPS